MGTFTRKCTTGLLRSQCKFIPIERQWHELLVMIHVRCMMMNNYVQHRMPAQSAARVRARSSCVCTRAQHHSLSRRMSSRAASRAGAARVCAQARRAYARKEARDTARARRAAPERDSREHSSPVLRSALGKIDHGVNRGS